MKEIDWEQRRYEIAKELFCMRLSQKFDIFRGNAKTAIGVADILIEEL